MKGVRRVLEGPLCTKAMLVQEVAALPADVDVARSLRFAAGTMDFRALSCLVENKAVTVAEVPRLHGSQFVFVVWYGE